MFHFIRKLIVAAVALHSVIGLADPPRANHHYWRNTDYPNHYVLYDYATRQWVETIDCRVFYRFRSTGNELNAITLIDDSRGMVVRLTYDGMFLKPAGASDFTFYQRGTFDTRESFAHNDDAGNYTGTISRTHACQWQEWFPGNTSPTFSFVQTLVDNSAVEMFDGSRGIAVRLEQSRMYLKQGTVAFGFFKDGHW